MIKLNLYDLNEMLLERNEDAALIWLLKQLEPFGKPFQYSQQRIICILEDQPVRFICFALDERLSKAQLPDVSSVGLQWVKRSLNGQMVWAHTARGRKNLDMWTTIPLKKPESISEVFNHNCWFATYAENLLKEKVSNE